MIMFDEIYNQAIVLFDDPEITEAFEQNKIYFFKLMYPFLNTSCSLFTQPFLICEKLSNSSQPKGTMEIFVSDGETTEFKLSFQPLENSIFEYKADGKVINGTYDSITNSVTFDEKIEKDKGYSIESYFIGSFNDDFKLTGKNGLDTTIKNQIISILARMLVKSWGEDKRNFLLDIQNILRDGEFSLHPASSALRAKDEWIAHLDEEIYQLQNKLSHNIRFAANSNWVRRYN